MSAEHIKRVAAAALPSIERILALWLPNGKRNGHEYQAINPTRSDGKLGSFSINCNTGAWSDFATGDKGGDLVALVAYLERSKQSEAAKRLADLLGLTMEKTAPPNRATSAPNGGGNTLAPPQQDKPAWRALLPVPDDAAAPFTAHPKHGKPSMRWAYRNEAGQLLCWVYRFEPKDEGERKQFFPLTWCEDGPGKRAWRWQGLPDPRPLYRLDKLAANTSAPVVVCEGEKAADAATLLFPDAICTTMLNGAQSPHKTDWLPLSGREVWLWPDHDEAGRECMAKVAALASEAGAASVEEINLGAFVRLPALGMDDEPCFSGARPLPDKWDAADALADGWKPGHVALLMQSGELLRPVSVQSPALVPAPANDTRHPAPADDAGGDQLPHFHCNDQGVWYFGRNEHGNDMPPLWVCSRLEITATTRDAKNESWGRLLEFDDLDGTRHAWAMPMELLSGDGNEYRRMLLSMGLQIAASTKARNLLTQYIQTAKVDKRARCVDRTGWHGLAWCSSCRIAP